LYFALAQLLVSWCKHRSKVNTNKPRNITAPKSAAGIVISEIMGLFIDDGEAGSWNCNMGFTFMASCSTIGVYR
jgi:hypothetical protein